MISTRESALRETSYPDSMKHIEMHNRGALLHITDAAFIFFVQLEVSCKRILKPQLIKTYKKEAVSVARKLVKTDCAVKRAWEAFIQTTITKEVEGMQCHVQFCYMQF